MLRPSLICNGLQRRFGRSLVRGRVEPAHRIAEAHFVRMQVRRRLRQARVAEHFLHVVNRPSGLEPATARLVSQIVKVQIDAT